MYVCVYIYIYVSPISIYISDEDCHKTGAFCLPSLNTLGNNPFICLNGGFFKWVPGIFVLKTWIVLGSEINAFYS